MALTCKAEMVLTRLQKHDITSHSALIDKRNPELGRPKVTCREALSLGKCLTKSVVYTKSKIRNLLANIVKSMYLFQPKYLIHNRLTSLPELLLLPCVVRVADGRVSLLKSLAAHPGEHNNSILAMLPIAAVTDRGCEERFPEGSSVQEALVETATCDEHQEDKPWATVIQEVERSHGVRTPYSTGWKVLTDSEIFQKKPKVSIQKGANVFKHARPPPNTFKLVMVWGGICHGFGLGLFHIWEKESPGGYGEEAMQRRSQIPGTNEYRVLRMLSENIRRLGREELLPSGRPRRQRRPEWEFKIGRAERGEKSKGGINWVHTILRRIGRTVYVIEDNASPHAKAKQFSIRLRPYVLKIRATSSQKRLYEKRDREGADFRSRLQKCIIIARLLALTFCRSIWAQMMWQVTDLDPLFTISDNS
ncbi:uncharacterized protein BDR25DRAFT_396369 [Lindgomyces ingoldianus]|uniref:Uncharacterized protein n=1 Tax=Lindgomyces ingoldianus TaxID=673940 RepID=A0ACB6QE55_9PLEO|nr:uncharacterized protein BDR25DRAFT_396369 [Lindgomyces ingoldianus]KAF2465176.1 hypothetical protein BDR25DRAFT_396369 [Lindgomyces ingoldianus]